MSRYRLLELSLHLAAGALVALLTTNANAQLPFPPQNARGPVGDARQVNYPYPGQCVTNPANLTWGAGLKLCDTSRAPSFACTGGVSNQTAASWGACGAVTSFVTLNPVLPATQAKFRFPVLNPPMYTPDKDKFAGADYYEIGLHEAWGFQKIADAGLFPNPRNWGDPNGGVPNGKQWTGLICPAGSTNCTPGKPVYTQIWGVGQKNLGGGPITSLLGVDAVASPWSKNDYIATWPSISIRATRGRPVIVRWVNEFPNNHVFCPHPEAADWPCAIDRTFMGVKASIDPATAPPTFQANGLSYDGVNQYGSPQQPDNSWVTHLHGGDIPPSTDGFAEKWFGNVVTGALYSPAPWLLNPAFDAPPDGLPAAKTNGGTNGGTQYGRLFRPGGDPGVGLDGTPLTSTKLTSWTSDTYTYPMVNQESTIWFHDHTLGKTHHNVIAGPAGFVPVWDPTKHGGVLNGAPTGVCPAGIASCTTEYTWLDPVTEPLFPVTNHPKYDLYLAIQDRSFNDDGSINFSNGLGQPPPVPLLAVGQTPMTPGVNPQVHPTWLPEYFGDHVLVNGVLWPYQNTEPGWYRLRLVDGSDSRCWTIGFSTKQPASGTAPTNDVPFLIIANDQGYMAKPVAAPGNQFTMCPGERYELLVNFAPYAGRAITMTNSAPAPYPAGITPFAKGSIYAEMNVVMQFAVGTTGGVPTCGRTGLTWAPGQTSGGCIAVPNTVDPNFVDLRKGLGQLIPKPPIRQVYLNERLDGLTLAPLGMQLNGVPFEYKVTETPKNGTIEIWQFINLTVDAHPMHPHLVKAQIVSRQPFNVGAYKALLCGSTTCQPGTTPGNEMQVVPDVTPTLLGAPVAVGPGNVDGGWKDAIQAMPGQVTTIIAEWKGGWMNTTVNGTAFTAASTPDDATAPGSPSGIQDASACPGNLLCTAAGWNYEPVTGGPYVWHCHINSHEDSEMMRTSLVIP